MDGHFTIREMTEPYLLCSRELLGHVFTRFVFLCFTPLGIYCRIEVTTWVESTFYHFTILPFLTLWLLGRFYWPKHPKMSDTIIGIGKENRLDEQCGRCAL